MQCIDLRPLRDFKRGLWREKLMLGQHNCFLRALLNQGGDQKKDKKKHKWGQERNKVCPRYEEAQN